MRWEQSQLVYWKLSTTGKTLFYPSRLLKISGFAYGIMHRLFIMSCLGWKRRVHGNLTDVLDNKELLGFGVLMVWKGADEGSSVVTSLLQLVRISWVESFFGWLAWFSWQAKSLWSNFFTFKFFNFIPSINMYYFQTFNWVLLVLVGLHA